MKNELSAQQLNYIAARAAFNVAYEASRAYDKIMDAECEKMGIPTPFGILPDGHPMWAEAQRLLDAENATKEVMYRAAYELFDWATSETFKRCGTKTQQGQINEAIAKIKKMAWVEQHFIEMVDISMRLRAA